MSTYIKIGGGQPKYPDCPPLLKQFLQHMITIDGYSVRTANTYYVNIRLYFRYLKMIKRNLDEENYDQISIDDISQNEITNVAKDTVIEYLYFRAGKGDSAGTRGDKLSAVKQFYNYLIEQSIMNFNPADGIKRPKIPVREPKYLTIDECNKLLNAASARPQAARDTCITVLFLNCGMRISELCSVNTTDIIKTGNDEYLLRIIGKGDKERTVYLNNTCLKAIKDWTSVRNTYENLIDKDALFVSNRTRRRLSPRNVENIIASELSVAGLKNKGYSPHKLRHTAATLMYDGGADILELKEILGHSSTKTTEIYTHVNNKQIRAAVDNNPLNKKGK